MTNSTIKIYAINLVFLAIIQFAISKELIIPKIKPQLSKEVIQKKIIKGTIIPLKKPGIKTEAIATEQIEPKKDEKLTKVSGEIIPKSKPLIVKKQKTKIAKKSKYFSERDFSYAKQAIKLIEKSRWVEAEKVAKKARNKSIYNFVQWRHLITTGNQASVFDYKHLVFRKLYKCNPY